MAAEPLMPDSPEAISTAIWHPERRNLTIGLLLTVSMAAFEALAVATILPSVVEDIGGLAWYGWVFSGFMLANLVSITMAGQAADRRGVVTPFIAGSVLFVAGLIGAGCAPTMPLLVVSRVAQGLGAGALSSVAYVAIAIGYPAAARPRMLAMLSSAWVVPGLIGPALAGFVADHLDWRWVFLGLVPPTVLASALAVPGMRRLPSPQRWNQPVEANGPPSAVQAILLAGGVGLLMFGLGSGGAIGTTAVIAGVMAALPALIRLLPAGTLRAVPGLPAAIATVGSLGFSFFAAEAFLPLSLTELRAQSATMSGIALTAATISWTTGAWLQARLAATTDRRSITVIGLAAIIAGVASTAAVIATNAPTALVVLTWGLAGLGMGLAFTTASLVVLEQAPAGGEGTASAAAQLANVLGIALGTGIGGAIVAAAGEGAPDRLAIAVVGVDLTAIVAAGIGLMAALKLPGPGLELPMPSSQREY